MAARRQSASTTTFLEHLKKVLESIHDPVWLGTHSPLAAPYFLGDAIRNADATPLGRGQVLCVEIDRVLETLWGGSLPDDGGEMIAAAEGQDGRYDCLILELNYLKQRYRPAPKNQSEIYNDILHISRPTHDRHLRAAVERLGTLLLRRLRPAVRPEEAIPPPLLIGRDSLKAEVFSQLQAGKSISLTGPGGVGKTSLAAVLADEWISPAVFWCTFRPTLNDQLEGLLFALGYFLHRHGSSTLWQQLVSEGGRIQDNTLALGLVRSDLESLAYRPLLCFDELDFLRPLTQVEAKPNHVQLLEFLDSLRGHAAMLLIGQRAFWESNAIYPVEGLTVHHLGELLTVLSIPHTDEETAALHAYTAGNLRLTELCIALYQTSARETLAAVLDQLPQFHGVLPLWLRLERRLPLAERQIVQSLSVFRTPAPADVWWGGPQEQVEALGQLIGRRLVQQDDQGGVALLPALREVVYAELPVDAQEDLHVQAAQIRAERGEYTAAAYHLQQAGQVEEAVSLWYAHRQDEIYRGQAAAALALFEQISLRRLSRPREKELRLLRSELYQLVGAPLQVIETLQHATWNADDPRQAEASLLLGNAYTHQSQGEQAMRSYADGLAAAHKLQRTMVELYVHRSRTYLHERDMQAAWQEANQARYLAENMIGTLHEQSGRLDEAQRHYQVALDIAKRSGYLAGVAKSYHNLGNVASRQRQLDRAINYYEKAMSAHEGMGDRVGLEVARSGIVAPYMQAARYTEAIEEASRALTFFQSLGDSFWVAVNASNLAESHVELGNYAEADIYVQQVLAEEEPHSHPYALFTLGRIRLGQGALAEAALVMDQARRIAEMNEDRYLLAYCWEEIGKIQRAANDPGAGVSLAQAIELFQALNIGDKVTTLRALAQPDA